jgi:putative PIN family toxin of toxin-antitoxin system
VVLAKLEDVLSREKFAERIPRAGSSVAQMMAGYRALVSVVRPVAIDPTARDPDDDHVLACATAAQAQLVISLDKDLLDLREYQGIPILASADALQHLDAQQHNS